MWGEGVDCRLLVTLPGRGPFFGLTLYDDYVYYTDWRTRSLSVYHLDTGRQRTLASGLMRPGRFVLHHPRNVSGTFHCNYMSICTVSEIQQRPVKNREI